MAGKFASPEEEFDTFFEIIPKLRGLQWTDADRAVLDKRYTDVSVHIALERADMRKDWPAFTYILNKSKPLLVAHLALTGCVFSYNFKVAGIQI